MRKLGSLLDAVCKSTELAIGALASIHLIDKDVLVVHSVVVVLKAHDSTLEWGVPVRLKLKLRIYKDLRSHWLRGLAGRQSYRIGRGTGCSKIIRAWRLPRDSSVTVAHL